MADNTTLNTGTGGDVIRDIDRAGIKTQVMQIDAGGAAGESLVSSSNPLPTKPDNVLDSLTTTASASSQTTLMSLPNAGFNGGSIHVTNAGTSNQITLEHSDDNVTWASLWLSNNNSAYSALTTIITSTGLYTYNSTAAYVRAKVSNYTSGTVTVYLTQKRNATSITPISLSTPLAGTNIGTVTVTGGGVDLPTVVSEVTASGTITVINSVPAGAATAGSAVAIATAGRTVVAFQVTGTYTGALSVQGTVDGTTWVTFGGTLVYNVGGGSWGVALASAQTGIWQVQCSGFQQIRVTGLAAMTGTATVSLRASNTWVPGGAPTPAGSSVIGTVTLSSANMTLSAPVIAADVASAALTTTTNAGPFTPGSGLSYEINIPVTVVSGTTPTLDVVIQESDDSGVNWFDVYHFPRITATGMYRSPKLPQVGNRVRYVQTVAGTTPSFTRAINRIQSYDRAMPFRRIIDRTLASTQALNATTGTMTVLAASPNLQLTIATTLVTTTAPALQLQGSEDGGVTWYSLGSPLTAVTASTIQATVNNVNAELVRAIVTTAGVSTTLNYVAIKAF